MCDQQSRQQSDQRRLHYRSLSVVFRYVSCDDNIYLLNQSLSGTLVYIYWVKKIIILCLIFLQMTSVFLKVLKLLLSDWSSLFWWAWLMWLFVLCWFMTSDPTVLDLILYNKNKHFFAFFLCAQFFILHDGQK